MGQKRILRKPNSFLREYLGISHEHNVAFMVSSSQNKKKSAFVD
jgi:hypothetical protein